MTTTIKHLGTLDIVTLDNNMVWTDEFLWNPFKASVADTLGPGRKRTGKPLLNEVGRQITLASINKQGAQRKSTIEALRALFDEVETKYQLTITHNGLTVQKYVVFRHEEGNGGAVAFDMRNPCDGLQLDSAWYLGEIRMEVTKTPV